MNYEEICEVAMNIIASSGASRSCCVEAIKAAKKFDFEKAEQLIKEADEMFLEAHEIQTDLITKEMNDNHIQINLLLVHSQDHLTMATIQKEISLEMIELYKTIAEMKGEK